MMTECSILVELFLEKTDRHTYGGMIFLKRHHSIIIKGHTNLGINEVKQDRNTHTQIAHSCSSAPQ